MSYPANVFVSGTVTHITDYGAFVKLPCGDVGMVHISKISDKYVGNIRSVLNVGDVVEVKIINNSGGKIALSMIKDSESFDTMLKKYLSASEESLKALNKKSKRR